MMYENYNTLRITPTDSDDSDSDEMLPIGDFWPAPEEEKWTMVERSHGSLRSATDIDSDRLYNSGDNLDHSGMRCRQLDYIDGNDNRCMSSEALSSNRKGETQIDRWSTGDRLMTEPATANIKPAVRKRPNVIVVEPRKTVTCPVNVIPTPQGEVLKSRCVGTHAGELFPEEPEVVPAEMAKEASTEGPTDKQNLQNDRNFNRSLCTTLTTVCVEKPKPRTQRPPDMMAEEASMGDTADNQPLSVNQLYRKTTVMDLTTDYVEIERPAPWQVLVDVAEEASTDDATNEQCIYEVLDNIKMTDGILSMELLEISMQLVTRGFLELAEEARNSGVEKKQSFLVEEVPPQVTGMTRPMIEPVSETTDEDLGKSVVVHHEGTARVPTVKLEAGQLMQWPDTKSDGVMIRGIMLESEMSPVGSVRCSAEPVSVAAKSEMFTPVFAGGSLLRQPLAVIEAVTSRVLSYWWLEVIF